MPGSKKRPNQIWIGTSGWTYDGWRGPFYPETVPKKKWLEWYSGQFATTEINGSFYRTPSLEAVASWYDATPPDFVFAWKASKFITHWKRLSDQSENSIELMVSRLKALRNKVGPILFQLPARFKADRERLARFLKMLPKKYLYAFEFRDASWYEESIFQVLRDRNIALCISDHRDAPAPWEVTASHVYVRGHGPAGDYKDHYPVPTLQKWSKSIKKWQRDGLQVFCYFDNDQKSAAPIDANRLIAMTAKSSARKRPVHN